MYICTYVCGGEYVGLVCAAETCTYVHIYVNAHSSVWVVHLCMRGGAVMGASRIGHYRSCNFQFLSFTLSWRLTALCSRKPNGGGHMHWLAREVIQQLDKVIHNVLATMTFICWQQVVSLSADKSLCGHNVRNILVQLPHYDPTCKLVLALATLCSPFSEWTVSSQCSVHVWGDADMRCDSCCRHELCNWCNHLLHRSAPNKNCPYYTIWLY